jgi:ubiquinone/menaquinone biosynthesis C-methylase UbiE
MNVWQELHSHYQHQYRIDKPSLLAETAMPYFPKGGKVLELGAGHGQDSLYFASQGFEVVSTDIETAALEKHSEKFTVLKINLLEKLPFEDASFDAVYAHLSLHYFDLLQTERIFQEIERVLRPGGVLAFLANSTDDPEYATGVKLEEDFFLIGKVTKRYFSVDAARALANGFQIELLDNQGHTFKDQAKGIHNLIRFVGKKGE